jgi:hypothetical protein
MIKNPGIYRDFLFVAEGYFLFHCQQMNEGSHSPETNLSKISASFRVPKLPASFFLLFCAPQF